MSCVSRIRVTQIHRLSVCKFMRKLM